PPRESVDPPPENGATLTFTVAPGTPGSLTSSEPFEFWSSNTTPETRPRNEPPVRQRFTVALTVQASVRLEARSRHAAQPVPPPTAPVRIAPLKLASPMHGRVEKLRSAPRKFAWSSVQPLKFAFVSLAPMNDAPVRFVPGENVQFVRSAPSNERSEEHTS